MTPFYIRYADSFAECGACGFLADFYDELIDQYYDDDECHQLLLQAYGYGYTTS